MLKSLLTAAEFEALGDKSPLAEHYEKGADGNYILKTDDKDYQKRIKEFRDNNIRLNQEIEDAKKQVALYADIDPVKAKEALEKLQALEDKNKIDAGNIDEVVEQRVSNLRTDLEGQTAAAVKRATELETENSDLNNVLASTLIDAKVGAAINKIGTVRSNALGFITTTAKEIWKLRDKKATPIELGADGKETVIYGKDAKEPLTMDEWAVSFVKDNPWAMETTRGAGGNDDKNRSGHNTGATISATDREGFSKNIEAVADGKMTVVRNPS